MLLYWVSPRWGGSKCQVPGTSAQHRVSPIPGSPPLLWLLQISVFPDTRNHLILSSDKDLCSDTQTHSSGTWVCQRCGCRGSSARQAGQGAMAGQQNIKGSKLSSDYFVYCASGFWRGGAIILSSLPWAVKARKAFVLDWCLGKTGWSLSLFLYQVCQVVRYVWNTYFFSSLLSS